MRVHAAAAVTAISGQPNTSGSAGTHASDGLPAWSWIAPLLAGAFVLASFTGLLSVESLPLAIAGAIILAGAIFASVHHAEVIAHRVGQPYGSIVLAVAVTVIEASLILSLMLVGKSGTETLARDTIYATVMIVLNGIIGGCLVLGGARYHEQEYQTFASAASLSVLGTLCTITLILPNYTLAVRGPMYSPSQLIFVATVSAILYFVFLFVQTIRHRDYFASGSDGDDEEHTVPSTATALFSSLLLCVALAGVVLLAKLLSPLLEHSVAAAHLPKSFVGVVIAGVVLLPEGISAMRAARRNHLQTSLNIALGSAMATIGLTIPIVSLASLLIGQPITLGLGPEELVLLVLTLFISSVTLGTGRATILQGAVHLVIFGVFLFLAAVP